MDSSVKALLAAGANKDAKNNVSTGDACDDPLMADDPSHDLQDGWTALIWAAESGHEGCVKALLAAGANKDAKNNVSTSDACEYPLMADDPSHDLRMETRPSSWLPSRVMRDVSRPYWQQEPTRMPRTM